MTSTKQFGGQKFALKRMRMVGDPEATPSDLRTIMGHLLTQKKPHIEAARTRARHFLAEKPDDPLPIQVPDQVHTKLQHLIWRRMLKLLSNPQQLLANR